MQDKRDLEEWYGRKDPWGYETNKDDAMRKANIIHLARFFNPTGYERALDIGAGEGWVTKDLPAAEIHGYELSDVAAARFPENVHRVMEPIGDYDLLIATGVLYRQYDWRGILETIKKHGTGVIIVAGILDWLIPEIVELGVPKAVETFNYRQYKQVINVFIAPHRTD